jgi:hypothetical protein
VSLSTATVWSWHRPLPSLRYDGRSSTAASSSLWGGKLTTIIEKTTGLVAFVRTVESGSFSAAAGRAALGRPANRGVSGGADNQDPERRGVVIPEGATTPIGLSRLREAGLRVHYVARARNHVWGRYRDCHRPRKRAIQYSETAAIESRGRGVLDTPMRGV